MRVLECIPPLQAGSLTKPSSIILVEYPKRLAHEIPDTLCGLPKVCPRVGIAGAPLLQHQVLLKVLCGVPTMAMWQPIKASKR